MSTAFAIQAVGLLLVILCSIAGYRLVRRTKEKTRASYAGSAAIYMGSLVSPHHSHLKEMQGMITNEIRQTEPADENQ